MDGWLILMLPYGGRLLRPAARQWIVSMWLLSVIVCTAEGVTWARLMALYLPPEYVKVAIIIGGAWGVGIFILEASFCMLDVSTQTPAPAAGRHWTRDRRWVGALLRIVIIGISLVLTSPVQQVAASALFLLLLIVILTLKLCQPDSVSIYYNDALQEAYAEYLRGSFDSLSPTVLDPAYRAATGNIMDATRFHSWYYNTFLKAQNVIEAERVRQARESAARRDVEKLQAHLRSLELQHAATDRMVQAAVQTRQRYLSERATLALAASVRAAQLSELVGTLEQRLASSRSQLAEEEALLRDLRAQIQSKERALNGYPNSPRARA
jgi:hypothetical protein